MVTVEFKGVKPGRCVWCGKEKDKCYEAKFSNGSFNGLLCKADLVRAIEMNSGTEPPVAQVRPANNVAAKV